MAALPFNADDGAVAYFGPEVGRHVGGVRHTLRCAERRLQALRDLVDTPAAEPWHVEMELTEFLTWARQVRVAINDAVIAAHDDGATAWWAELRTDTELTNFTARRDRALKRVEQASECRRIRMDIDGAPHSVTYFAFVDAPYAGDPVFPRCQKHFVRVRDIAEHAQLLLPPYR